MLLQQKKDQRASFSSRGPMLNQVKKNYNLHDDSTSCGSVCQVLGSVFARGANDVDVVPFEECVSLQQLVAGFLDPFENDTVRHEIMPSGVVRPVAPFVARRPLVGISLEEDNRRIGLQAWNDVAKELNGFVQMVKNIDHENHIHFAKRIDT